MQKRLNAWRPVVGDAVDRIVGPAINTGVFGWRSDWPHLAEWERLAQAGWEADATRRLIDELACQVLLGNGVSGHEFALVDDSYNHSVRFGKATESVIIHYHGDKHVANWPACEAWKSAYRTVAAKWGIKPLKDKRLSRWLQQA